MLAQSLGSGMALCSVLEEIATRFDVTVDGNSGVNQA